jgi:hypothetical protein
MSMRTDTAMEDVAPGREASNPLAAAALAMPDGAAAAVGMAARAAGGLLALWIAIDGIANSDDTYTRTVAFAIEAAVVAGLSLTPLPGRWGTFVSVLGGAVVLFTGALLWFEVAGMLMVPAGAVAVLAALAHSYRRGDEMSVGVGAFFVGSGVTAILIADVVLKETRSLLDRGVM